jgi:hypothetical protein
MTTQPPADPSPPEPRQLEATPASEARQASSASPADVDWPDRSHWSEFDAAIEAQVAAPEAAPTPEGGAAPD